MTTSTAPRSAHQIPASGLCLGTMYFGTTVATDDSMSLLDRYLEQGGRWLDTANNYAFWVEGGTGDESELLLGRWMASRGTRDGIVLASKVGARPRPGSTGLDNVKGLSAPAIREQVHGSLRRLGTDHLDLLYAHVDDTATALEETLTAFDHLVSDGTVGAVASSNLSLDRLQEAHAICDARSLARYTATQLRATYLTARPGADLAPHVALEEEHTAYARGQGMVVLAYAVLLGGAYERGDRPVPEGYRHAATDAQLQAVNDTATRLVITPSQVVLAWLRALDIVPVLGVSRPQQLDAAMTAISKVTLDEEALEHLHAARALDPGTGQAR